MPVRFSVVNFGGLPERTLEPPGPGPVPRCPVCGEETDTYYRNRRGEIAGCGGCLRYVDAWSYGGEWGEECGP